MRYSNNRYSHQNADNSFVKKLKSSYPKRYHCAYICYNRSYLVYERIHLLEVETFIESGTKGRCIEVLIYSILKKQSTNHADIEIEKN